MISHKAEAIAALAHIRSQLADGGPEITGLVRRMLVAAVDEAIAQVDAIEELKRARRMSKAGQ